MEQSDRELEIRLQKIKDEWNKQDYKSCSEAICFYDLRLMLEHFQPLQQLIRDIAIDRPISSDIKTAQADVVIVEQAVQSGEVDAKQAQRITTLEEEIFSLKQNLAETEKRLSDEQARLQTIQKELVSTQEEKQIYQQKIEQLSADLGNTEQHVLHEKARSKELEQQLERAVTDADELNKQVSGLKEELKQNQINLPVLDILRQETALAQRLGLAELSSNALQAVIKMVAVLSQLDSLERLWDVLKEHCKDTNRKISDTELCLLQSALEWYNYNWNTRPFKLLMPEVGSTYDYEKQQKSTCTPTGEVVLELVLPGIADGAGKVIRKTVVATH